MIHFKKIRYKNFLSTGNVFTEIQLDRSPNTLVIGINGAGKSTLLDALTFILYGKPFRGINKDDLVNSINNKDCVVEVEFRIGIKEYKVVRGIKPSIFEIYVDGILLEQEGVSKDYQRNLEENILQFNYKAFTQIVILGASSFVPFMQLKAADRRIIIEDLLDIQVFSSMNKIAKGKLSTLRIEIESFKKDWDSTLSKIEMQKKYVEEAKKNNQSIIEAKKIEYQETIKSIDEMLGVIEDLNKKVAELLPKADETKTNDKLKKINNFKVKIESNKTKILKERDFFLNNDNCPTCKQEITATFKESSLSDANNKIVEFDNGLSDLNKEYDKVVETLSSIRSVQKEIQELQSKLAGVNITLNHNRKFADKLKSEIESLQNKRVLSDDMLSVSEKLVDDLNQLRDKKVVLEEQRNYLELATALLKDNGIKAKIIKQYLPVINKMVNKYLTDMGFFVNFELNEEFEEIIKSRYRDEFKYGNFSEGEGMRIDLSLLFTWRAIAKMKNSMHTNLLILDEVFDSSLDIVGTEEFMKLLNSLGDETNVFVISHKSDILIDKFKFVIKFEKINNFSRMAK